jgi:hypothetical protein
VGIRARVPDDTIHVLTFVMPRIVEARGESAQRATRVAAPAQFLALADDRR